MNATTTRTRWPNPQTESGARRALLKWCRATGVFFVRYDAHDYALYAPIDFAFGANGERVMCSDDYRDLLDRASYGVAHMAPEFADTLAEWPDRQTDPVTAGIVADYLEERDAPEDLIEQYRDFAGSEEA
jgi:hypothetical protein